MYSTAYSEAYFESVNADDKFVCNAKFDIFNLFINSIIT